MSIRSRKLTALNLQDDVVTVTEVTDPKNGTADVTVSKETYVDGYVDTVEVDKGHVEVNKGHVEIDTSHVEAGHGHLEIDSKHTEVSGGHKEVHERHTEITDGHVVTIEADSETNLRSDGKVDTSTSVKVKDTVTPTEVKDVELRNRKGGTKSDGSCHEGTITKKARGTCFTRGVHRVQKRVSAFVYNHARVISLAFKISFLLCYYAVFGYAMYYKFGDEGSIRFLVITIIITLYVLNRIGKMAIKKRWSCCCWLVGSIKCLQAMEKTFWRLSKALKLKIILCVMMMIFFLVYVIVVVGLNSPENLISAAGMIFFIATFFAFSYDPSAVAWRPVVSGLSMQFVFALMLMRSQTGAMIFLYLGDRIMEFMEYADAGAKFVFGPNFADHFFAFKVLPVVIFFSTVVSILYYWGVMQFVIKHIGRLLTLVMNTTPAENIVAVGNIFVGQTEAPLLAGPYLQTMTRSQLHTVMTSGFATAAGPIMAAFALYKVPVLHLLSASVMSAPAAIGMSKLFYPETEDTTASSDEHIYKVKNRATNTLEAASNGAIEAVKIVANIIAHLIAFVSLLMFMNAAFTFLGYRVGLIPPDYPELTFQLVYSYIFWPVAFMMGISSQDCGRVAELIGTKMVINEFAAYAGLSNYILNRNDLVNYLDARNVTMETGYMSHWDYSGNDILLHDTQQILQGGIITDRSTVIATYALCGFSNASAMGIMLGALVAIIPKRKADLSRVVFRAMIAGNVASFMTACMAGLLYGG
ncbi:sodium/nucleoside cotransporter 1-like [Haliotis rubra]|uniref:sodium/nucleoside cotransporter 1-like n=1 Tax=Haliotis rubra TaxID=36100 RepID=UPI001EE61D40|nr:sodium/nucleoside cotransporter 1-like [Haliotis rubra]